MTLRLQVMVARDRDGAIVETIEIDRDGRSTPRLLKKFLKTLPDVARVERITTHVIGEKP